MTEQRRLQCHRVANMARGRPFSVRVLALLVVLLARAAQGGEPRLAMPYLVKDINPGGGSSSPQGLTVFDNRVVFRAFDPEHGLELWVTDGSPAGTSLLRDIVPGPEYKEARYFTRLGERVIFLAADLEHGEELWSTDGTIDGTRLLKDIWPGPLSDSPEGLTPFGDSILFSAGDPVHGREIWITDGTSSGTRLWFDMIPGAASNQPRPLAVMGNSLIFSSRDENLPDELWITDGTPDGTRLLRDISPGLGQSFPNAFTAIRDRLVFSAEDPEHGREPWVTDGTPEGTMLLKDIRPGSDWSSASSAGHRLTALGDRVVFWATNPQGGPELWVTDGSPDGTSLLKGPFGSPDGGALATPFGVCGNHYGLTPFRGELFFTPWDPDHGFEPWITDGTSEGTRQIANLWPGPETVSGSSESCLISGSLTFDDYVFFNLADSIYGHQLWMTDGTPEGTVSIDFGLPHARDFSFSPVLSTPERLYLITDDGEHGEELWALPRLEDPERPFRRGDPNSNGSTDISDAISIFGHLFLGDPATLSCLESGDTNNDGTIDISDGIAVLFWLFAAGPEPAAPGPPPGACGLDTDPPGSPEALGCTDYAPCS